MEDENLMKEDLMDELVRELKTEKQKSVTLTINKSSVMNGLVVLQLVLLVVFGWQIYGIKQSLADGAGSNKIVQAQPTPNAPAAAPTPSDARPPAGDPPPPDDEDYYKGNKDARITLIEYSDYECPFCQRFHPTAQQVVDEYNGQVNWVYRHFPLSFHANAQKEAEAAECAGEQGGDEGFWEYTDKIFERSTTNGTGFALTALVPLAEEIGLNKASFQECLDSGKYAQKVKDDMAEGGAAGVTGTPGTFIYDNETGDSELVPGALPFSQIKSIVDGMLNE